MMQDKENVSIHSNKSVDVTLQASNSLFDQTLQPLESCPEKLKPISPTNNEQQHSTRSKTTPKSDSNQVTENEFLLMKTLYKIKKKMIIRFAQHLKTKIDVRCQKYFKNVEGFDQQLVFSRLLQFVSDEIDQVLLSDQMQHRLKQAYDLNVKRAQMENFCLLCHMCIEPKKQAVTQIAFHQKQIADIVDQQWTQKQVTEKEEQKVLQQYRDQLRGTLKTVVVACNLLQNKSFFN